MSGLLMWLCVLGGTALLGVLGWFGMNAYGQWAKRRDEAERLKLQEEWRRRAADRKAKAQGAAPDDASAAQETGENPPLY